MPKDLRLIWKLVDKQWIQTAMQFLRKGDYFKMYEPTGEAVELPGFENKTYIAESSAYQTEDGVWQVDIQDESTD